jgi:5-formyltetrahydrofolate cyclo-ligase
MNPETSHQAEKSSLRQEIRQKRRELDSKQKDAKDRAIHLGLVTLVAEIKPSCVAAFWPFDGEPNLLPAMDLLERDGATLALPVIQPSSGKPAMIFRQWSSECLMTNNHFGIPEPTATKEIPIAEIDLILLPLVGWDSSGNRLGMGAGFYDRILQPFARSSSPLRVGVAYQLQKVANLPAEPWDIQLHGILTESGWLDCQKPT